MTDAMEACRPNRSRVSASSCVHNNSDTCSATEDDTAFLPCVEITIFCGGGWNSSTALVARWCSGRASDFCSRGREFDSRPVHCRVT